MKIGKFAAICTISVSFHAYGSSSALVDCGAPLPDDGTKACQVFFPSSGTTYLELRGRSDVAKIKLGPCVVAYPGCYEGTTLFHDANYGYYEGKFKWEVSTDNNGVKHATLSSDGREFGTVTLERP